MAFTNRQKGQILVANVNRTLQELRRVDKSTSKEVLGMLKKTREELSTMIKDTVRFEMPYYRAMLSEIDGKIGDLENKLKDTIQSGQNNSFGIGEDLNNRVFKTVEIVYGMPKLSDALIATAKNYTADLIKNMADEMKDDISRSLRQSLLIGEDNFSAARKIDEIIGIDKRMGYMNRSDTIARTEIGRAFSVARQASDEEMAKLVPGLKKQWVTGPRPRNKDMGGGRGFISHSEVDGQIREVDEPFDVGGEQLMYPRDKSGKPENVCNCNCNSVPYKEDWE